MRRAVRGNQSIDAERTVVGLVTKVTTIRPELILLFLKLG